MTPALTPEIQHKVADVVARAWLARGVTYDYADIYQDAVEIMHRAQRNYSPSKGTFAGYLYGACWRKCGDRLTRAMMPAGTRSNDEVPKLRNLRKVRLTSAHVGDDPLDYDDLVYRTQIRERLKVLADRVPEGQLALAICLDLTTVAEQAEGDSDRTKRLYYCVKRMKKAIREDRVLACMASEGLLA